MLLIIAETFGIQHGRSSLYLPRRDEENDRILRIMVAGLTRRLWPSLVMGSVVVVTNNPKDLMVARSA